MDNQEQQPLPPVDSPSNSPLINRDAPHVIQPQQTTDSNTLGLPVSVNAPSPSESVPPKIDNPPTNLSTESVPSINPTGVVISPDIPKTNQNPSENKPVKPPVMNNLGFNDRSKPRKSKYIKLGSLSVAVIILALLYFWILPSHLDKQYISSLTPVYNKQSTQMFSVYESLGQPTFATNGTTPATDTKDIAYSNMVIKEASSDTSTLKTKNKLIVLPGTQWLGSVNAIDKKYKAVKTYVTNSQAFLADYMTLTTYISQLDSITSTQLPNVFNALSSNSTAKNLTQLLQNTQNASATLSGLITSLNALHPPTDLKQLNASLIGDLQAVNNDLEGIIGGINSQNSQQISASAAQLEKDFITLSNISNTNVAGLLQNNSLIHSQVVKLEAENPLGSSTSIIQPSTSKNTTST